MRCYGDCNITSCCYPASYEINSNEFFISVVLDNVESMKLKVRILRELITKVESRYLNLERLKVDNKS
jgi:hypothetical protein